MSLIAVAVEVGVEIDPSRIVFGVMGVQAEKVAVEALAKPVAYFGLYQPMFPPGVAELPRIVVLSRKCPDEIDTSGVRLEEDGTQKARLWLVRANDLPEMDELLTLRFNGLYHNMIKNIAETGGG